MFTLYPFSSLLTLHAPDGGGTGGPPPEPTPAATPPPAPAPTPPAPAPAAPPAPNPAWDADAHDPERAHNTITKLRGIEKEHKAMKSQWDAVMKAFGVKDGVVAPTDPEGLQKVVAERDAALASEKATNRQLRIDAALARITQEQGLNGDVVANYMKGAGMLNDADPDDPNFVKSLSAQAKSFGEKNPQFKAGQAPNLPPVSGLPFPGGSGGTAPITREDIAKMSPAEITAALEKGEFGHLGVGAIKR